MARIRARPPRGGGWICALPSLRRGSSGHRRWWTKPSAAAAAPPSRGATSIGRGSPRTIRSSPPALPHGCSATRTGGSGSSGSAMALDTAAVDRALGAIGTTFRLRRLYPPSHPAVMEAVHHLAEALPPLAGLGTIECRVAAAGLHWQGQHLIPRNPQIAELAGLLYARGVRAVTLAPGVTTDHVLALLGVAMGTLSSEDTALGPIALARARRGAHRFEPARTSPQAAAVPAASATPPTQPPAPPAPPPAPAPSGSPAPVGPLHPSGRVFRPDARPPAGEAKRALYRGAIRKAAGRGLEPLRARRADEEPHVVAAAAELMGLTGSPQAVPLLAGLLRHPSDFVREAALLGLAEGGGREVSRPAMPALKDESIAVRIAAVRAIMAGGDSASTTVLIRRLEQESDEGVQAEMLRAIGRLGGADALDVLAHYAEPGGRLSRRSATVRAAAIDGLRHLAHPDARGLLELYSHDKEPLVRKAAETALK